MTLFNKKKIIIFLCLFFISNIFPVIHNLLDSINVIRVNSIKQEIIDFKNIILTGDVEIWVDKKIHIWADKVEIDKEKKILTAFKLDKSSVVVENNDFLILADKFFLNLNDKTGYADNIRIQVAEGYIKAGHAEKVGDNTWQMNNMLYTPCDDTDPHWSISAKFAKLYSNYVVRVSGVLFKFGRIPFFYLPAMVFPVQNRSKSGFLLPKFSYDENWGFGLTEEYYWRLFNKCDTTIGFSWKQKMGIALEDDFRWVRSPTDYTLANAQYAIERRAFIRRQNKIVQATDHRYWITGKDYRLFKNLPIGDLNSLARVDFGTDKNIEYQFGDDQNQIDDTFYNSFILRKNNSKDIFNIYVDWTKVSRRQFTEVTSQQREEIISLLPENLQQEDKYSNFNVKKDIDERVNVYSVPHFEWNSIYRKINKLISYRNDIFVDQIFLRKNKEEDFYINSNVVKTVQLEPLQKGDSLRFYYDGEFRSNLNFFDQSLELYFNPNIQARSKVKDSSLGKKYRALFNLGAQYNFPEANLIGDKYLYYLQPNIKWDFISKYNQSNWFYADKWDRIYPKNQLTLNFRNNWYFDKISFDLNSKFGYEFYSNKDIFNLDRIYGQKHFIPPNLELGINFDLVNLFVNQEYDWRNFKILTSEIGFNFSLNKINFALGSVYQDKKVRCLRGLLSDIPHFLLLGISFPVLKNLNFSYDGQFYTQTNNNQFMPFNFFKPLSHFVKFEYNGHCFGISVGFEQKTYREYGNWKSERAFSLFIKLDSLGSFTRKFKRPTIYKY